MSVKADNQYMLKSLGGINITFNIGQAEQKQIDKLLH